MTPDDIIPDATSVSCWALAFVNANSKARAESLSLSFSLSLSLFAQPRQPAAASVHSILDRLGTVDIHDSLCLSLSLSVSDSLSDSLRVCHWVCLELSLLL